MTRKKKILHYFYGDQKEQGKKRKTKKHVRLLYPFISPFPPFFGVLYVPFILVSLPYLCWPPFFFNSVPFHIFFYPLRKNSLHISIGHIHSHSRGIHTYLVIVFLHWISLIFIAREFERKNKSCMNGFQKEIHTHTHLFISYDIFLSPLNEERSCLAARRRDNIIDIFSSVFTSRLYCYPFPPAFAYGFRSRRKWESRWQK